MKKRKITIVSDGNGAVAAAAELALQGHDVTIFNLKEKIERMKYLDQEITLLYEGKESKVKINYTSNPVKATRDAYMIMYSMPGYAIPIYARLLAPTTDNNSLIFFNASASFAPLIYIKATGIEPKYALEAHTLTYATRVDKKNNTIDLKLKVKEVFAAASVCKYTDKLVKMINEFYPQIKPAKDLLHVFLLNANPETHCAGCILNAGRIDYSKGDFYLYKEGITKSTLKVMRQVAKERRSIAEAYGYQLKDEFISRIDNGYFKNFDLDFVDDNHKLQYHFNNSPIFRDIKGPSSVGSRYFLEDIAIGLVHWEKLAKEKNIPVLTITALIEIGEAIEGQDYRKLGNNLIPWELVNKCKQ